MRIWISHFLFAFLTKPWSLQIGHCQDNFTENLFLCYNAAPWYYPPWYHNHQPPTALSLIWKALKPWWRKKTLKLRLLQLKATHPSDATQPNSSQLMQRTKPTQVSHAIHAPHHNSGKFALFFICNLSWTMMVQPRGVLIGPFDPPWLWKDPFAAGTGGRGIKRYNTWAVPVNIEKGGSREHHVPLNSSSEIYRNIKKGGSRERVCPNG